MFTITLRSGRVIGDFVELLRAHALGVGFYAVKLDGTRSLVLESEVDVINFHYYFDPQIS